MARHVSDRWRDFLGPGALPSLVFAGAVAFLGLGLPVVWQMRRVSRRSGESEPVPSDLIVVLGRALDGDRVTRVFQERLARGAELWRQGLAPKVLVAGGLTGRSSRTEAEAGLEELRRRGLPDEVLLSEGSSRHTLENLSHVREILGADLDLLIVSDPIHTARISAYATGLKLRHRFAPAFDAAPTTVWGRWLRVVREAGFLHWYHCGVLYSRLTRNEEYLARVT